MVRTWVSSSKSNESIENLEEELSKLESRRDQLIDSNKLKLAEWASYKIKNGRLGESAPRNERFQVIDSEIKEVIGEYESLNDAIVEKQMLLTERMNEQTKMDSLG